MSGLVHYISVATPDGQVMGYAWGDPTDVGWADRKASSVDAYKAGMEWYDANVRTARERGVAPLDVLDLLSREPGVSPVTAAPDVDAIEELARTATPADDQRLVAALDRDDAAAWRELAEAFDALTDEDRKVEWGGGQQDARGVIQMPYPRYSEGLLRAVNALRGVAVTTEYRWSANPPPQLSPDGRLSPADAVRAAMVLVLGERICDGMIDEALRSGLLDATVESLRTWYEAEPARTDARGAPDAQPPGRGRRSPFSRFVFAPFTLIWNLVARRKIRKLPHPASAGPAPPLGCTANSPMPYVPKTTTHVTHD
ncbi:DUF6508 domain-containing protein [Streptomyces sp. RTd22]|uniref:DUF6508 domain-containing protein n=1 Tax=Streptomyces sp. RTd22 TaxID=1841249 RepID=UPI0007C463E7|nr:DUF6508 domain-containing protein [Streptomyces sp. RTd22]